MLLARTLRRPAAPLLPRLASATLRARSTANLDDDVPLPSVKPSVTPDVLRASANKMLDAYTRLQRPDGSLEGFDDPCHYCKLPNALAWGGRIKEADAMLDHCVNTFLRPNGDFTASPTAEACAPQSQKTIHWEFYDFYSYLNQWWITAGVRLSRSDFVHRATSYVLKHWHNQAIHAGCLQAPLGSGRHENCIFTSAHLGFTLLHAGAPAEAERIGRTIVAMVAKQPRLAELKYYNRFDDSLELLTSFAPDDPGVKLAAIVDGTKPDQCWWSLGYPVAFLAHLHLHTGDPDFLATAENILEFVGRCDDDVRNNIVAHKVMWGASLVGAITGKREHWELVRHIAGHILTAQAECGRVMDWKWERGPDGVTPTEYGAAQLIDQTGEIAYWFFVVARQMEKAELAGKLA